MPSKTSAFIINQLKQYQETIVLLLTVDREIALPVRLYRFSVVSKLYNGPTS